MSRGRHALASLFLGTFALFGTLLAFHLAFRRGGGSGGDDVELPTTPAREAQVVAGVVLADGAPVPGVAVHLFEDRVEDGGRVDGVTGPDGAFRLAWVPRATWDRDELYVWAAVGGYAPVAVPADPARTVVRLGAGVAVEGVVVDARGAPADRAVVHVALRHAPLPAERATVGPDGRFRTAGRFPKGAPVDVRLDGPGLHTRVERAFRAGQRVTLRAFPGRDVSLEARDPYGRPITVAPALAAPPPLRLPGVAGVSDGGPAWITLAGDDRFLSVEVPAWPHETTRVVLWPRRDVRLLAWDAWNRRGVEQVEIEVQIRPDGGDWWGDEIGKAHRRYRVLAEPRAGLYTVSLPACPLLLRLAAPGYGDAKVELDATRTRARVRMQPPVRRDKPAHLRFVASGHAGALPLLVTDDGHGWLGRAVLRDGKAALEVPPDTELRVASAGAAGGVWLPVTKVAPAGRGKRRTVTVALHAATRLEVVVEPAVAGEVRLVDLAYEKAAPPQRAVLSDGIAELWARPLRTVRVEVHPESNHFAHEGEFATEAGEMRWTAELRDAAGLRARLVDGAGHPVAFGGARVWEPGLGGQMVLRADPKVLAADADGVVFFRGLRRGEAVFELLGWGFRARRFALVRLATGSVADRGDVVLEPAGVVRGRVVDSGGRPLAGVGVRTLAPRVDWLPMPGGGSRDFYDLTAYSVGAAATDADGAFEVRDGAPRGGLVALYPGSLPGFAALAAEARDEYVLPPATDIELDVRGGVEGVYVMVGSGAAVLVKRDPPMSLRPLPVRLPAGVHDIYVRMRDGRSGAERLKLEPGVTRRWKPQLR